MNNILKDLWYGNVAPCEHCGVGNIKLNRLIRDMERVRVKLSDTLSPQQAEQLEALKSVFDQYSALLCEESFASGFQLGTQITIAAMETKK